MATLDELSRSIGDAVERAGASLVRVDARAHRGATGVSFGDGVIVTAHHAVERDEGIVVTLPDGSTVDASLVGRDPGTDVAVLRIEKKDLPKATFAPLDGVRVGQLTVTLARPGRSVRASLGIIGALGDEFRTPGGGKLERYVQTDVRPQQGFSGGIVVDLSGSALGMNTTGVLRELNLVVPTASLERIVGEIVAHGQVRRGFLGVGVYPVRLTPALEQQFKQRFGLGIVALEPASPAETGGLLLGDVLVAVDGQAIGRPSDLTVLLEERVGVALTFKVLRAGALRDVAVTPGQRG